MNANFVEIYKSDIHDHKNCSLKLTKDGGVSTALKVNHMEENNTHKIRDEPPSKKTRELIQYKQDEIDNSSFFDNSTHCDVIFCIPNVSNSPNKSEDDEKCNARY